ncbi:RICIN domain-containing protein [Arthrobacter sp. NPDC058127]|uniref:RICIN domain-containing protein n=1 Tax=Arthrobacter sp. NPDC058127 TaxID=3346351 RepID=UPI0036E90008
MMFRYRKALSSVLLAGLTALVPMGNALAAPAAIVTGAALSDDTGRMVQAHGAGITKVGDTYYMVGEDKEAGQTFTAVSCYSSKDLTSWHYEGHSLTLQASGDLGPNRVVERPKIIYNDTTHQYVMYFHADDPGYQEARVGVATSPTPCGPYAYHGSFRPLGFQSRDMGLFKDDDGTAYLLTEDRANGLRIDKLSADYLSVVSSTALVGDYEAPAMVKVNGRYMLFGSQLTGWSTNDNVYATATSPAGPWTSFSNFAPAGSQTFNSQLSTIVPVTGTQGTSYMYVGDRWQADDLFHSPPVWLPIELDGTTAKLNWYDSWSLDAAAGTWSPQGAAITYTAVGALVGIGSGRCLDVPGGSTANGILEDIWDCNGGANQQWNATAAGELRIYGGSKCLDLLNNATAPGSSVGIWGCNGGTNQQWTTNPDGTIVSRSSGLCLDVTNQNTANGTSVKVWTCNGGTNQQWRRN